MPKILPKRLAFFCILLWSLCFTARSQDAGEPTIGIISFIRQLEQEYNVKFSYVDADLGNTVITIPESKDLGEILDDIAAQTQFLIKKLNDRYYTIAQSTTVSICAKVLDNFGENTIPGATIEVLESSLTAVTGPDGSFSMDHLPRKATLRIRYLGFKSYYTTAESLIKKEGCPNIMLGIFYQQLDEVVVSHILTTGITRQWDGSIRLEPDEFGILPGLIEPDVLQTVQALPGIRSIDETVSDINIRGGTNDQNLLLWDGIKMYQSGHFFGLISAFNPYLTEAVTVIKNGTSARYGDGVSGIISMETHNDVSDHFYGGAGINLISGDLYGHLPLGDNLAFQFSARRSVTDFLNTPTYNQFFERAFQDTKVKENNNQGTDTGFKQEESFYFYDFTGKLLYDLNDGQKLRLSFIAINNALNYLETAEDTGRSNQSTLDQTNLSFGGSLSSRWSDRFSSELSGYYTRYNLDAQNNTSDGQQQLFQNNEVLETSVKLHTTYSLNEGLTWGNGYQFTEVGITNEAFVTQPPFSSDIKGVIRTHAPYTELRYEAPGNSIRVIGGLRFNAIENLDTFSTFIVEPRLNLTLSLGHHLYLDVLGEFKNQTTNQVIDLEQNFLGIEKRRWILSDDNLLPVTRSKQGSVGINYDHGNWYFGAEGFYKLVKGISTATQGFQNENQFNGELGEYDVKGFEFLVNYKNALFSTWLSYTYNNNTYTFDAITPSKFPNNLDIRHTLTLGAAYTYKHLKLGAGLNYRSGKPYTEPQRGANAIDTSVFPNTINYRDPNSSRLPDYLRVDASATYDFALSHRIKATVGASVLNLLNKRNLLNTYYRLNDQNEIETVESISLGLTPNLSFRVRF
jgi:hypothetical protein